MKRGRVVICPTCGLPLTCTYCNGTGRDPDNFFGVNTRPCPSCGGKGWHPCPNCTPRVRRDIPYR